MKKIVLIYSFIVFLCLNISAQEESKNNISLGLFIGEGTGILTNFNFNKSLNLEWNIAYHELFYKYKYTTKYKHITNPQYDDIYSSSILFKYRNSITNDSKLNYSFAIGTQIRFLKGFYATPITIPPDLIVIDDPEKRNKIDLGISSFIGLDYQLNKKFSLFADAGIYLEILDEFLWKNVQFRTGILYKLN